MKEDLLKLGFGWISNSGECFGCEQWCHVSIIEKIVIDEKIKTKIDEINESVEETRKRCQELADNGEHPEWHSYEMADDDACAETVQHLFNSGWIRIGTTREIIEAEGLSESITTHYQLLKDLEEESGLKLQTKLVKKMNV